MAKHASAVKPDPISAEPGFDAAASPPPTPTFEAGGEGATGHTHLRISARIDGFRRCGRAWPGSGVTVAKRDFSDDDIARLKAEPELVVVEVEAPE